MGTVIVDWQRGAIGRLGKAPKVLRPQTLEVFKILEEHVGNAVSKEVIIDKVWPGLAVTDDSLVQCISEIRSALADNDRSIIKTLSKRGYIYDPPVAAAQPTSQDRKPANIRSLLPFLPFAAAVFTIACTSFWFGKPATRAVQLPAIAVLPFSNLSADPRGERFADMMTEDVITDLSHSKDFAVIARNSSEVYKGKPVDIRAVGRDLNVKYVLEGSVEALPGRLRATAQLIDAQTNAHVWAQRFEEQGDDIFAVEANLTNRIANSIVTTNGAASNAELNLIRRKPPQQWNAYEAFQAGYEVTHNMDPEHLGQGEQAIKRALEIDPNFARAHVGMAWLNLLKLLYGLEPRPTALPAMLAAAKRATELDPQDGEAHAVLAQAYSLLGDAAAMDAETERALALAPNNADLLIITSPFLLQAGQSDRAVANVNKALALNPNYPFWQNIPLMMVFFYAGDFQRSFAHAEPAWKTWQAYGDFYGMAAAMLGKTTEQQAALKTMSEMDPAWSAERLLSNFGNYRGEKERNNLITAAKKAGLRLCFSKTELAEYPYQAVRLPACDVEREKS